MISFIIATYNRPDYLAILLWSIKNQTSKDWEVIVMDEGENQSVVDMANDKRIKRYTFERIEMTDGRGSCGILPKNAGVKYAKGEYLCFPSEDTYYVPIFVEEMLKQSENLDIVMCNFLYGVNEWKNKPQNYSVIQAYPSVGSIDTCNYIIKPKIYLKYPFTKFISNKIQLGFADGLVPKTAVENGASWKAINQVLVVHN